MAEVIEIAKKRIAPDKICWNIDISAHNNELLRIARITKEGDILISLMLNSFDRIEPMRQEALKELDRQAARNEIQSIEGL